MSKQAVEQVQVETIFDVLKRSKLTHAWSQALQALGGPKSVWQVLQIRTSESDGCDIRDMMRAAERLIETMPPGKPAEQVLDLVVQAIADMRKRRA